MNNSNGNLQGRRGSKSNRDGRKRRRRRWPWLLLLVVLCLIGFLLWDVYRRVSTAFEVMHVPIGVEVPDVREEEGLPPMALGDDPFSVLILGTDGGRSDAIMVATVNPTLDSTYLVSIARDTMVDIPGFWTTRINHAFAYGGIDLAVTTVQNLLNIPIDYHATLDMHAFPTLVDAFGGVTVYNNTVDFSLGGYHFPLGMITLTGSQAFYYARMRMDDPRGDHGRAERQRDILSAMAAELAGVTVVTRYQQILDSVGTSMATNVMINEMVTISIGYNRALRNITNLSLSAPGQIINGMYLIPIPEEQRLEMSQRLRNHLELE